MQVASTERKATDRGTEEEEMVRWVCWNDKPELDERGQKRPKYVAAMYYTGREYIDSVNKYVKILIERTVGQRKLFYRRNLELNSFYPIIVL